MLKRLSQIAVLSLFLFTSSASGKIVVENGIRYYKVGQHSFILGATGSGLLDDTDANAIIIILEKEIKLRKTNAASDVYKDIHKAYKGPLLGKIYRSCICAHIHYVLKSIDGFTKQKKAGAKRPDAVKLHSPGCLIDFKRIGNTRYIDTYFAYVKVQEAFNAKVINTRVRETRTILTNDIIGLHSKSHVKSLNEMLDHIQVYTVARGSYNDFEKGFPELLKILCEYFSKAPDKMCSDLVSPLAKVFFEYSKTEQIRKDLIQLCIKYNIAGIAERAFQRGKKLYDKGSYKEATQAFNEAISIDSRNDQAYYWRGVCFKKQGEIDSAVKDLEKACGIDPYEGYFMYLGLIYYKDKANYKKAISYAAQAISANSKYAKAYNLRGWAYFKLKQDKKALDDFNKAIKLDNSRGDYFHGRASVFARMGMYELADVDVKKATEMGTLVSQTLRDKIKKELGSGHR